MLLKCVVDAEVFIQKNKISWNEEIYTNTR